MKNITCIIFLLLITSVFIVPVSAEDTPVQTVFPSNSVTIDIPPFEPMTDQYMRYWFTNSQNPSEINPLGFIYSFVHVYDANFGALFFVIVYVLWLFIVWNRSRGVELVVLGTLATAGVWGLILPAESIKFLMLILALGIAAIMYRLLKTRK